MNHKTCQDCQHYLRHYTIIDGKLKAVFCGHCRKFAKKKILPDRMVCDCFEPGIPIKKEMVSKQYLTKELLSYLLSMELFPEEVAETMEEAENFLEECLAVVVDSVEEVIEFFEEEGIDMDGADGDEILEAAEVFDVGDGRYLIVEG